MTVLTTENVELFSEEELENLEFLPEELEDITSEQIPDLESISLKDVARDLEAFFEEDVEEEDIEEAQLERLNFRRMFRRGRRRSRSSRGRRRRKLRNFFQRIRGKFRRPRKKDKNKGQRGRQAVPRAHGHGEEPIICYSRRHCGGKDWEMRSVHNCCSRRSGGKSYRIVRTGKCHGCG